MQGYQLTFFTQQDRMHGTLSVAQWLIAEAKKLGVRGATMSAAEAGYGRDGKMHAVHFFELAEQPVEVTFVVSAEAAKQLFARIEAESLRIFYVQAPVEYGITGER